MIRILNSVTLAKELYKVGLLPPECHSAEVHIPDDDVMFIRYDRFLEVDDIAKLAIAIGAYSEAIKAGRA